MRRQETDPRYPDIIQEDEDSGCECSLEEIEKMERMDAWSKTLVAIRVLTEFKKRRKKTMEAERVKKEKRKNLWRRMRLKLKIFNIFANKISSEDPATQRILKLKRKIGRCKGSIHSYWIYNRKIVTGFLTLNICCQTILLEIGSCTV